MPLTCGHCKSNLGPRSKILSCAQCKTRFHLSCLTHLTMDDISFYISEITKNKNNVYVCDKCDVASVPGASSSSPSAPSVCHRDSSNVCNCNQSMADTIRKIFIEEMMPVFKLEIQKAITDLKNELNSLDDRVKKLELSTERYLNNENIPKNNSDTLINPLSDIDTIHEIEERQARAKNVIVFNLPEPTGTDNNTKETQDIESLKNIMNPLIHFAPLKVIRLGKIGNKPRPVKIVFAEKKEAIDILRVARAVDTGVLRFKNDLTIMQRNHLKKLNEELMRRKSKGEKDCIIKYINGQPSIVKSKQMSNK